MNVVQRMKEIGDWMKVNGEAIYGTRPVAPYKAGQVVFTRKGNVVFLTEVLDEARERVKLLNPQEPVAQVLDVIGLKEFFEIHTDLEAGVNFLANTLCHDTNSILDVVMPGMDGFETCAAIRKLPR